MWLPKDERKLLVHYYEKLHTSGIETRGRFFLTELEKCLSGNDIKNRVKVASNTLRQRNLLDFVHHQVDAITIQLSLEGHDLGRDYCSWWSRSNLWYAEYIRNHWIWIIVSFFGGVIATLLVQWLSKAII